MTAAQDIDYEALAQDAMRSVVRNVLTRVAKTGLPGEHHFYVAFNTQAPGVTISKRLKEKYPAEMTIVLQHRFWDLSVTEDRFEVKLSFDGLPERLVVPFAAIKVFFDPSVRYGLQFEEPDLGPEAAAQAAGGPGMPDAENFPGDRGGVTRPAVPRKPRAARKPRIDKETATRPTPELGPPPPPKVPAPPLGPPARPVPVGTGAEAKPAKTDRPSEGGAQVVSLDAFRKR
jgi:hypothetical protein